MPTIFHRCFAIPTTWPLAERGFVTRSLLDGDSGSHPGLDIAVPTGSYIRAAGDGTVTDLMHHVDLSQPLVSWHLRRLKAAGLVETRRQGRETICSLGREALLRFHAQELLLLGLED